jgi:hypothetical protein
LAWVITWKSKNGRTGIGKLRYSEANAKRIAKDLNWDYGPKVQYTAMDEDHLSAFYVIAWRFKGKLRTGSITLTREKAQAEVDKMNRRTPWITHRVLPVRVDL